MAFARQLLASAALVGARSLGRDGPDDARNACETALWHNNCLVYETLECILCGQRNNLGASCTAKLIDSVCSGSLPPPPPPPSPPPQGAALPPPMLYCTRETECRWQVLSGVALHPFVDHASVGVPGHSPLPAALPSALDCMRLCKADQRCRGYTYKLTDKVHTSSNRCWLVAKDGGAHKR
eukprot:3604600-Prymnesium_polylepis.1